VIIFQLDPGGNIAYRFVLGGVYHLADPLVLQYGVEGFCPGVVPAYSGPARGGENAIVFQVPRKLLRRVLAASIRMENRCSSLVGAAARRHIDGITHQR